MIIVPDSVYNPNFLNPSSISSATKLGPGISIAKFLGAYGDRTSFSHVGTGAQRLQIARNLYMHAELMRAINGNTDFFNDVRLIVSEGIYRGDPEESVGGDNLKKADGRIVVYQVIDQEGNINHEKTFDVAEFWKDYAFYERIALDYDTYNPDGTLTSQILLEFPTIPESFDIKFGMQVETYYNGALQSKNELLEIKLN